VSLELEKGWDGEEGDEDGEEGDEDGEEGDEDGAEGDEDGDGDAEGDGKRATRKKKDWNSYHPSSTFQPKKPCGGAR
jgi:hypothetical protein